MLVIQNYHRYVHYYHIIKRCSRERCSISQEIYVKLYTYFVLLYLLFECNGAFLVFAPFILEPHTYDPRAKSGHLD